MYVCIYIYIYNVIWHECHSSVMAYNINMISVNDYMCIYIYIYVYIGPGCRGRRTQKPGSPPAPRRSTASRPARMFVCYVAVFVFIIVLCVCMLLLCVSCAYRISFCWGRPARGCLYYNIV